LRFRFSENRCKRISRKYIRFSSLEIGWDKGSTDPADVYAFLYGEGNLATGFFMYKRIMREAFVSDRMSCIP
jgi:hypothetical protein